MLPKKSTRIRKEEIVQAALKVIGTRGASALTIAAIAEVAGMSEANIYRHFGGKQEILTALADFIGSEVMGKAAAIAAGSRSPLEKLHTIFTSHIALIAELPGIPRFIFSEEVHLGDRELSSFIAMRMGSYVETLTGIIAAGIAEGEIRDALSPRETALTLLGMIQFTALRWTVGGNSFDIGEEAARLWDNFLRLVR
ncbi:TetR/AcrR family transcriptional regulator [Geobacter sp.]|uniref:TetR/AcrR family transcriptional regulator n=1 Tax=Geobacter sp. TaxID=46610 RepID=UPI00260ACA60|nr:TetR/AcrR family transcriptional regulator [Geobacter sp.]